ncbi:glutathione S-transferase [Parvibaculum sedimenti]|uniref:Glutathione S-transferase n=1 Tax=Parvibaculum sedimenti TaxID=2608632 RepID=A0A6N6VJH1_9HYPH|nr:glutathione S-transferase N-terminal domain-containing protein [Parvibaculum sedimenti]KAB7738653.1 glutathione S-transferase [Parvibaculum sedimenti]
MNSGTYRILGGLGSPYSMKMRAVLRYRRLPHVWVQLNDRNAYEIANVKPAVIPIIQFPDGSLHNDSTPMIFELERLHAGQRSIVPDDEGQAFLAFLLEDMADEWGTKMMFHYRWFRQRDQKQMSEWLAFDRLAGHGRASIDRHAELFAARQIGRMALVGCTAANQPLIEETARRVLALLEVHVTEEPYLFGSRPSLADFGWMGQLSQLAVDPTPADLMREAAPYTFRWLAQLDDASGIEGEWRNPAAPLSPAVKGLLAMAGEVYFPFLVANEEALKEGAETFSFVALGMGYEQGAFRYQAKCLAQLRERFRALSGAARERLTPALREAGCLEYLAVG